MIDIGPNLTHLLEGFGSLLMFMFMWYILMRD